MFNGTRRLLVRGSLCVPVLAGLIVAGADARADVDVWSSIGPEGGNVFALAIDPSASATIYAGTGHGAFKFSSAGGGGVFKSTNGGAIWAVAGSGLPGDAVLSLAIDPVTTSTVYAGTRNHGVWKSTDGGGTWTPPAASVVGARVFAIVVDPKSPATLYAATASAVLKSTDGATTWTATTGGLGTQPFFALAIDPATPSTLYAGTQDNGIFKSVDGAATWTAASTGLTGTRVFTIAVDPKTPSTLYAGTNGQGIFKSTDATATWKAAGAAAGTSFVIAIDPVTPTTVYACANSVQVLKSLDGVATWNRGFGITNEAVSALAIDPSAPSTVYVGTATGVFKTTNGGVNVQTANRGLTSVRILSLAVDPAAPATVYAGTDVGLYKSVDAGVTWTSVTVSPNVATVFCLAILPGSSTILAGMGDGGWRSKDGGATWTHIDTINTVYAWASDPGSPKTVYAAGGVGTPEAPTTPAQGLAWKSPDAGADWAPYGGSPAPLPVFESIVVAPTSTPTVIVGTDSGVYGTLVHRDGGLEWVTNNALATRVVYALAVDPSSSSILWAGTDQGLFRSTDGAVSWAPVTNGLPSTTITALEFDPASASTFYAGTIVGLFRSTDHGTSWTPFNAGLGNAFVNAFAIAPGSATLYVGTSARGVYRFPTPPPVADFTWAGIPVAGQPFGFTDLSTGNPTSWSWTFGDGGVSAVPFSTHTFAAAGPYQVSLTVTNAAGENTKTQTVTVAPAIAGSSVTKVVPIVLDVSGVGGARFSTELTLANRGTTSATLQLTYVAATSLGASGSGTVGETLGPGRQIIIPDTLAYLRGKGLAIPTGSNRGGALFVTFEGLSSDSVASAGARTTAPSAGGRAGLAYPAVRLDDGFTGLVYLFGLRENAADRSNLALVNMNEAVPITLRVTLHAGADGRTTVLPNVALGPGQWTQIGRVLAGPGYANGWATVELVSGPGPFDAYAVFNDNVTSDGSFVAAVPLGPATVQILPVLVETGTFQSELVLSSPYADPITLTINYVESLSPAGGAGGVAQETLQPYEQKIIPNALDYLRGKGVAIGAKGAAPYAGAVQITAIRNGNLAWLFAGARTAAPAAGGGEYGLFYRAAFLGESEPIEAWVFGLQQDATNRSNLAVVNPGNGHDAITVRLDVYDGDTGKLAGSSASQSIPPGGWFQWSGILTAYGVMNGYVRVVRLGGSSWMIAYGVVNDGATPGSGATNDGSYVTFSNR
ncbi:MAG: PKD domain-containing protein [Thermoanaerobaculia bacterium]